MPAAPRPAPFALPLPLPPRAKRWDEVACLVAVSGGLDSVCLLHALRSAGARVVALHCNFHLRGSASDGDEAFVRQLCRDWDVPLRVMGFDTVAEALAGESIEMTARRLRYDWFAAEAAALARDGEALSVAVAHHADDNAETVLLHLLRGTGLHGLTGMRTLHTYVSGAGQAVVVWRPLLALPRRTLQAYAAAHGLAWRTDASNADTAYRRNAIRHTVLPVMRQHFPATDQSLARLVDNMQSAEALVTLAMREMRRSVVSAVGLSAAVRATLSPATLPQPDLRIDAAALAAYSPAEQRAFLAELLRPYGGNDDLCRRLLSARQGACFPLGDRMLCVARGGFHLGLCPAAGRAAVPLRLGTQPVGQSVLHIASLTMAQAPDVRSLPSDAALIDAASVDVPTLCLRPVAEGDRFAPYGMPRGTRLVSDILTARRCSRLDKARALCVADAHGILWLVGETVAQRAALTAQTERVLQLTFLAEK